MFVGVSTRAIEAMVDKITTKNAVVVFGVPVVRGVTQPGVTDDEMVAAADEVGYPVSIEPFTDGGAGICGWWRTRCFYPRRC
ncbi:hypothetical protein [Mycobacterium uberis]|uniref:ATP-binding protein n=1 Tax=Mycobacterium uberis TaxID=2162698 RepID=UPI0024363658|nr:hypothetical protein [Mycobacterium uberis]